MKVTWFTAKYGDPYSEFVLCIYPSKVHTHSSEHTAVNTHPQQRAAVYAAAPGEQLRVRCLARGHLVVVLKVERVLDIHSPHQQSLQVRDLNSQPFDYESKSLPLGHDFPRVYTYKYICKLLFWMRLIVINRFNSTNLCYKRSLFQIMAVHFNFQLIKREGEMFKY